AAELLREVERVELSGAEYLKILVVLCLHGRDVFFAGAVTGFAADAGDASIELKLRRFHCRRRVARETPLRFVHGHSTTDGLGDGFRYRSGMQNGDAEPSEAAEVAHAALVHRPVVPEEICLSVHALSKAVEDRLGDGRRAVADCV